MLSKGVFIVGGVSRQTIFAYLLSKYGPTSEETLSFVLLTGPVYACMIAIEMVGLFDSLSHHLVQFIHSVGQLNTSRGNINQQSLFPPVLESTLSNSIFI